MDELETVRMAGALVGMLDGLGYADGDIHGGAWVMEPHLQVREQLDMEAAVAPLRPEPMFN